MSALLPCPFCGSVAGYGRTDDGGHYIECSWGPCSATTNLRYTNTEDGQAKVVEQWNRRTSATRDPGGEAAQEALRRVVTDARFGWLSRDTQTAVNTAFFDAAALQPAAPAERGEAS